MRKKITERTLESVQAPKNGRLELWDAILPGFGVRVTPNGHITFCVMYRADGRKRRHTLGRYPALTLAGARDVARQSLDHVARGRDPAAEKRDRRQARPNGLFATLADEYIERHAKKQHRAWKLDRQRLDNHVIPHWGKRSVESITRADVVRLVEQARTKAPVGANRVRSMLSRLFNWAIATSILSNNPVIGTKPTRERSRERVLKDNEIKETWIAVGMLGVPWRDYLQTLMLTAQRRNEVATMRWTDLDLEADKPTWTIPAELNKAGRVHVVPLSPKVGEILRQVPRFKGPYVFTSTSGKRPVSGFSKVKARLHGLLPHKDADSDLTADGWRLHDFRRTATSYMAGAGFAPHILSAVLNHASRSVQGVTAIYNRHGYDTEKRAALNAWAAHVEALTTETTLARRPRRKRTSSAAPRSGPGQLSA